MPDGKTFRENIEDEKRKLASMNFKQRLDYLKTYYLTGGLIVLGVIVVIVWILIESSFSKRDVMAAGLFINVEANATCYDFLTEGYVDYKDISTWKAKVDLAVGDYIDFDPQERRMDSYESQKVLYAQISTGFFTYIIMDESALDGLRYLDIYMDPSELFTSETEPILKDAVVFREMPVGENGETQLCPVAIDLTKIGFSQANQMNKEQVYIVFVDVDADKAKMTEFLTYLCTHPSVKK